MSATSRRWLILTIVLALPACKRESRDGRHDARSAASAASAPTGRFRATGTLIHDGLAADDTAAWSTEIEIMKSNVILELVGRDLERDGIKPPLDRIRQNLAVKRRADSRIIEVSVWLDDDRLAQATCNLVLSKYFDYRRESRLYPLLEEEQVLSAHVDELKRQLDKGDDDPATRKARNADFQRKLDRLAELRLQRDMQKSDVRLLDRCTLSEPKSR